MPAGGVLGGAGTGAQIGTAIMPGIGTAFGAGIGGLIGWLSSRNDRSNDERQNTLEILNSYLAQINADKALNPNRAYQEMLSGRAMANLRDVARYDSSGENIFARPGTQAQVANPDASDPNVARIQAALRDPATYSMRPNESGGFTFDPNAFNPLQLARSEGSGREGGYQLNGQQMFFGQNAPPPPQPAPQPAVPRQQRPEDFPGF